MTSNARIIKTTPASVRVKFSYNSWLFKFFNMNEKFILEHTYPININNENS